MNKSAQNADLPPLKMAEIYQNSNKKFVITKRIAKHGDQSIIVIPRILEAQLKPGTITQLTIEVMDGGEKYDK